MGICAVGKNGQKNHQQFINMNTFLFSVLHFSLSIVKINVKFYFRFDHFNWISGFFLNFVQHMNGIGLNSFCLVSFFFSHLKNQFTINKKSINCYLPEWMRKQIETIFHYHIPLLLLSQLMQQLVPDKTIEYAD